MWGGVGCARPEKCPQIPVHGDCALLFLFSLCLATVKRSTSVACPEIGLLLATVQQMGADCANKDLKILDQLDSQATSFFIFIF